MRYYTVQTLRDKLNELIDCGMGERAVSFPICQYEDGWDGDYILIRDILTEDLDEITVYLVPQSPATDKQIWEHLEDERQMKKGNN